MSIATRTINGTETPVAGAWAIDPTHTTVEFIGRHLVFTKVRGRFTDVSGSVQISDDPFTNTTSQHRTEVEPDTFAFGPTWVSAFQVGRFFNGGASDIGFATTNDEGNHFVQGFLLGRPSPPEQLAQRLT